MMASVLALSACSGGSSDEGGNGSGSGAGGQAPVKGGTVEVLQNADFSYLDPSRAGTAG